MLDIPEGLNKIIQPVFTLFRKSSDVYISFVLAPVLKSLRSLTSFPGLPFDK